MRWLVAIGKYHKNMIKINRQRILFQYIKSVMITPLKLGMGVPGAREVAIGEDSTPRRDGLGPDRVCGDNYTKIPLAKLRR
ncbi:MAG: hypothetical protein DRR04_04505 [Gammaproteobacteria bacterium]|nr:MAG: hypothetical protein DRR04_04505 [Gammaproteobacteria bacterium]